MVKAKEALTGFETTEKTPENLNGKTTPRKSKAGIVKKDPGPTNPKH